MKARGALIISGEMRRPENCVKTIEKLSKFCDLDVFVHTWDQITWRGSGWRAHRENIKLNIKEDNLDHKELMDQVKPKGVLVENKNALDPYIEMLMESNKAKGKENPSDFGEKIKYTNLTCLSQLYSSRKSYDLFSEHSKEHDIKYDFVIKSRSDIEIQMPNKRSFENQIMKPLAQSRGYEKVWCPWICLGPYKFPINMDYCIFFGAPPVFESIYKGFPIALIAHGFIMTGKEVGGHHGAVGQHFLDRKIRVEAPLTFKYRIFKFDEIDKEGKEDTARQPLGQPSSPPPARGDGL